jgi:GH15 family glucan-1,4-alpha-glucosidase
MTLPLEDYGILSDCHSAAIVGKNGSIDWLAFPRFDSAACFAALVGKPEHGLWKISPKGEYRSRRTYQEGSLILETIFETSEGSFRLIDCMPIDEKDPSLIRVVEGISGKCEIDFLYRPRFDYGSMIPWIHFDEAHNVLAVGGPDALILRSDIPLKREEGDCVGSCKVGPGDKRVFVLSWYPSHLSPPEKNTDPFDHIAHTRKFWRDWKDRSTYKGFDEVGVAHSLMILKALTYKPTGAIVAAATTSLPEELGGCRNWDYRFSWIRDSSLTLLALQEAGYFEEAKAWKAWLLRAVAGNPGATNIMYGIRGERRLTELELDWLPGYEDSRPVRIGNKAHTQFQLDVFGELLAASYIGRKKGIHLNHRAWEIETAIVDYVCEHWHEPDEGIWEVRNVQKQFTHSKLMAWQALRYAVENVRCFNLPGEAAKWQNLRDRIKRDICEKGFNQKLNSFVQSYESDELDASLLMMAKVGFLPAKDPRIIGTVKAIQDSLMDGGLVRRYHPESGVDGIQGTEGCFIPCTFWLVDNLRLMGRRDEALELYRHAASLRNDVGLFSEEYSVKQKRLVGNFPQAFSHIAHAVSAMGLEETMDLESKSGGIDES